MKDAVWRITLSSSILFYVCSEFEKSGTAVQTESLLIEVDSLKCTVC